MNPVTLLQEAVDALEDVAREYIFDYGTDEDRALQDMINTLYDKIDEIEGGNP